MTFRGNDLFKENSLLKIFLTSCFKLSPSRFNTATTIILFCILAGHVWIAPKDSAIIVIVRTLVEAGLNFSASILGFLIAGFTIFATLTKPSLLIKMYETTHPESGLNYLKYNFFAFLQVFAILLFFLGVCVVVKILGVPDGAFSKLLNYLAENNSWMHQDTVKAIVVDVSYLLLGTLFFYSVVSLKSFIFNIYHVIVTSIVWELNSADETNDKDK